MHSDEHDNALLAHVKAVMKADNNLIDLAKEYANSCPVQTESAPRDVVNPGLYFGFLAGYRAKEREGKGE